MKILIEESVLRQALKLVDAYRKQSGGDGDLTAMNIRTALDDAEKVEPFAWIVPEFGFLFPTKDAATSYLRNIENDDITSTPLYAHPAPTTLVDSLAEKMVIATREIEGWKAVADAGEKIIAARDEQIAELEEKLKQQIRFRGEALRERDELLTALTEAIEVMKMWRDPECWEIHLELKRFRAVIAKLGADKTGEV